MSSYTTAIVSPHLPGSFTKLVRARKTFIFYFPNQKRRNVWDAISRGNLICSENILFLTDHNVWLMIGTLRCGGDEKVKLAIASQGKTTTLHVHHAFLYISLPSTARLPVKMPNFTFCEGRKQAMTKFILSMNLDTGLIEIQLQKSQRLHLTK